MNAILVSILVLLVLHVFFRPILFYFKYKMQARPTVETCDPSSLPEIVRENFDVGFAEFSKLQFRHCGTFTIAQFTKNFKSIFATYEHEQHNIVAVTSAFFLKVNGQWKLRGQQAAMGSRLSDGMDIDTLNLNDVYIYPLPEGHIRTQHPELQDISDLFAAHMSIVEHHRNGRQSVSDLQTKYNGDILRFYSETIFKMLSFAESCGYLKLKESQIESAKAIELSDNNPFQSSNANPFQPPPPALIDQVAVFVPTLAGAYKIVWQVIWPMKHILRRIRNARDRKLLAKTGYRWP